MPKSHRSAEKEAFWRGLLKQHRQSGMRLKAFCLQQRVSVRSFYAWRKRITEVDSGVDQDADGQQPQLIPVKVVSSHDRLPSGNDHANAEPIEIVTPGGFTLRVGPSVEPDKLAAVLQAITSCQAGVKSC